MVSQEGVPGKARADNESPEAPRSQRIALVGNPNAGKTTLFNALTGLKQKTGNYPGVTVDRKTGSYEHNGQSFTVIDLPGTYSLTATSDDERIVRDMFLGLLREEPDADLALIVVDATNLERQLFLATQVMDLGLPTVIALTMNDIARKRQRGVDTASLSKHLGVPVVEVIATQQVGINQLKRVISVQQKKTPPPPWKIGNQVLQAVDRLADFIGQYHCATHQHHRQLAVQLLTDMHREHPLWGIPGIAELIEKLRTDLDTSGQPWREAEVRGRYEWIRAAIQGAIREHAATHEHSASDRIDSVLLHPIWGVLIFVLVMGLVFQLLFTWSAPFMDAIDVAFSWLGEQIGAAMPPGPLRGLMVDGIIAGIGGVMVFLPQILFLFLGIAILEDSGYMARAAFLMNRHMRRAGLHGRAFIPLLAGFACSIPALMATRAIPNRRDKLVTMLVVPLVSCGARLPVFTLVIAAFVPAAPVLSKFVTWQGVTLWAAYLFSLAAAITAAFVLRKTLLRGPVQPFVMELPGYRIPHWRTVLFTLWERGKVFVMQAGTIILAINILLWLLLSYPTEPPASVQAEMQERVTVIAELPASEQAEALQELEYEQSATQLKYSTAGWLGRVLEPAIEPLGFDWKIGIGLVGSLAAREVFVSTMAVVYGMDDSIDPEESSFISRLRDDYGLLTGISIILFFILACQCLATVAVMRRESGSWQWALFMFGYMTVLAYVVSLVFYQVTSAIWPEYA